MVSVNPRMLKTKSGQETIKAIPADRLLLETDAPFTIKIGATTNLAVEFDSLVAGINRIRMEETREQIEKNQELVWS